MLENAAPGRLWPSAPPQTGRVRKAIRQERKDGLRLALRLRLAVLGFVSCYLIVIDELNWHELANAANLIAIGLIGWAQFRVAGTRLDRPAVMALFPVADMLVLVLALFGDSEPGRLPRAVVEDSREFSWFVLLLALQALAYRPWLAAWSGFVTALAWTGVEVWMLSYPEAPSLNATSETPPITERLQALRNPFDERLFADVWIWIHEPMIALLCGVILAVAVQRSQNMMGRAVHAERGRANLARHFSPSMVDQLAAQDRPFGRTREQAVGVLFADMVGFTRLAENSSPDGLIRLLRDFHGRMARTIFEHGGTLDKFIGDSVMATFGTPNPSGDDATRTIACCRAIATSIGDWNVERAAAGLPCVRVGVGAHYGYVVVGDIGDERRLEFAVLGDTVNVASRLEGLTRELSTTILISDELVRAARSETGMADGPVSEFVRTDPQILRNRAEPVALWAWHDGGRSP